MAEGFKQIVISTQERAISSDINRLQRFAHKDSAELFRFMLDVFRNDDDAIGTVTYPNTVETPLRAEIIEGLLCKPQIASFDIFVDPGCVFLMAPDAAPDESNYKFINDGGVSLAGTLVISANVSGSTRIDVVECRMNPVDITATESRDVFDPVTGLFAATVVTKERQGRLEYRVRAGIPAAGMPANALGWLPLMVASVPNAAADNDDVTFWDVRPLIADREKPPFALTSGSRLLDLDMRTERVAAADVEFKGTARAYLNGRRVGGIIRRGTPGTDADQINIAAAANQDTGAIAEPLTDNVHVYLATPFGLPRWARYTDAPLARVPRAPMGIPIVSQTVPLYSGAPSAALALPASTGLSGSTSAAVCVSVHGWGFGTGEFAAVTYATNKQVFQLGASVLVGAYNVISTNAVDFHIRDEDWPPNARAIWAWFSGSVTVAATSSVGVNNTVRVYEDNAGAGLFAVTFDQFARYTNPTGAPVVVSHTSATVRIPLPIRPAGLSALPSPRLIQWLLGSGLTVGVSPAMQIVGFEL